MVHRKYISTGVLEYMLRKTRVSNQGDRGIEQLVRTERCMGVNSKSVHTFTIILHAEWLLSHALPLLKPTSKPRVLRHGHRAGHLGRALRI